jgi:hypothetical protein
MSHSALSSHIIFLYTQVQLSKCDQTVLVSATWVRTEERCSRDGAEGRTWKVGLTLGNFCLLFNSPTITVWPICTKPKRLFNKVDHVLTSSAMTHVVGHHVPTVEERLQLANPSEICDARNNSVVCFSSSTLSHQLCKHIHIPVSEIITDCQLLSFFNNTQKSLVLAEWLDRRLEGDLGIRLEGKPKSWVQECMPLIPGFPCRPH